MSTTSASSNELNKSDIESLIQAETDAINALRYLKHCILKAHKEYSIAKTVGASTATAGTVATILGLFLAPVTAGLSLGLTAGGIAGSVLGGGTTLTTKVIETRKTKKWADELQKSLKEREEELKRIGVKITTSSVWKDYMQHAASSAKYVCCQGVAAVRLGQIFKYLAITAPEYGLNQLSTTQIVAKELPCRFLLDNNNILTKNLAKMGVQTANIGVNGLRMLSVGIGIVGIGLDIYTVVDTWTNDPKLVSQIDKICEHLEKSRNKLIDLKRDF